MDNEDLLKELLSNFQKFQVEVSTELASLRGELSTFNVELSAFKNCVQKDISDLKVAVEKIQSVQKKHDSKLIYIMFTLSAAGALAMQLINWVLKRFA